MQKVKEEFLLSTIFVAKWLALSLGGLGIIYFAISLAYQKSYYDPIIQKIDLKISELSRQKNSLEITLKHSNISIIELKHKKDDIDEELLSLQNKFNEIDMEIFSQKSEKDKVGTGMFGVLPWLAGMLGLS